MSAKPQKPAAQKPAAQKPAAQKTARKKTGPRFGLRLRLMPLVMVALLATISLKANHLWHGIAISIGSESLAQQQPAATPPATTPPATTPPATTQPAATPAAATTPSAGAPAPGQSAAGGQPAAGPVTDLLAQEAQRKVARDPFNYTDEEVDVLQQLAKRRQELDQRARQLDEREALVKAAEQRMEQKMAELRALQATVEDLLKQRNAADEQQLASLVKIYENMKPKAAAQVFEEMDMDVLLDVVSRMNERKVAPILAQVSPTKAKELTYELAERRQLPMPQ